jgi:hypothetical protein
MRARWLLLAALAGCGDSAPSSPEDLAMSLDLSVLDLSVPDQAVPPPDLHVPPIDGCLFCIEDLQSTPDFASSDFAGFDMSQPFFDLASNPDLSCGACDGGVCDPLIGACAECSPANDTCADGTYCTRPAMACNPTAPQPCLSGTFCLTTDTSCGPYGCCRAPCGAGEFPCAVGFACAQFAGCPPFGCCFSPAECVSGCKSDAECQAISDGGGSFARCCNGQCLDTSHDNAHCGSCNGSCGPGTTCCGSCIDLATDRNNCGVCGRVCGNTQVCAGGGCQ